MSRYYDQYCLDCQECEYHKPGWFPDGEPYMKCGYYAYIFHPEKGVAQEHCRRFNDKNKASEVPKETRARSIRQMNTKQRK